MFSIAFWRIYFHFWGCRQFSNTVKFESKDTLRRHFRMSGLKKAVIVIWVACSDEISMLQRADLLDLMDYMMQTVHKHSPAVFKCIHRRLYDYLLLSEKRNGDITNYYKVNSFPFACCSTKSAIVYKLSQIFRQVRRSLFQFSTTCAIIRLLLLTWQTNM
jgi:hypothetical protein